MGEYNKDYRYRTQYYRPQTNYRLNKKKRRPVKKTFLSLLTIALVLVVGNAVVSAKHKPNKPGDQNVSSHVALSSGSSSLPSSNASAVNQLAIANMGQTINSVISNNSDIDMSVSLIDLDNNQKDHYGDTGTFLAGSTGKILTAEYFLHEVEDGKQSLTETVNGKSAEYELQQMIVISDDNSWEALNNILGYDNLQDYADNTFGFNDYQALNNSLTSNDIAVALAYLYEGKVLNQSDTQLLMSYLKQANYRDFIVPAIPSDDIIYHKIGLFEDDVNDAAIITHDNQAFVLTIFTDGNGVYEWPERADMMQQITKAALKAYFNQA